MTQLTGHCTFQSVGNTRCERFATTPLHTNCTESPHSFGGVGLMAWHSWHRMYSNFVPYGAAWWNRTTSPSWTWNLLVAERSPLRVHLFKRATITLTRHNLLSPKKHIHSSLYSTVECPTRAWNRTTLYVLYTSCRSDPLLYFLAKINYFGI